MTVKVSKPAINVREELADLRKPTGVAGEAMLRAETPQEQFNLIGAGRRNWVINGDFQVSQRGNFTTASSATDTNYTVDRFKNFVKNINADVLHTKAATVDGEIKNTLKMTATNTNSAGRLGFRQYIESGSNGRTRLAGKTATLSVWMKSNNPNAGFYFYDYGNAGYFYRVKHSGGGQWEKLVLTVPIGTGVTSSNYYGYELNFAMQGNTNGGVSITSGDYVEIAEPQFELGKVATPFEHRSYGEELALCQRYFTVFPKVSQAGGGASAIPIWTGNSTVGSTRIYVPGPTMRALPALTLYGTSATTGSTPSIGSNGTIGVYTSYFHTAPNVSVTEMTSDPSFRLSVNSTGFLSKGAAGLYFYSNTTLLGDSDWCGVTLDAEL